jgi:CheY-like chemotaxis protein
LPVVEQLLQGFRVLIASDHGDLTALFAAMTTVCGGVAVAAASAHDALKALDQRPHAVLLDSALPDPLLSVPAQAASLGVPVVAFTFREADPRNRPARFRPFVRRFLQSTDLYRVCKTLHDVVREAA